ncbi:unnamed protein product [Acidocella sp. C78]|uniref:exopolysaccharide biosynthesis polyprenyl glycosylphosphotransferase n=1 Tax=Acidocella sp. C78 TaxID=1671486 RepID=UPI00191BA57F|nr:exopolysaccharide biosynthesis polyprenyl glycosylphosphotransferase [Acidocella sp. C78]CAG4928692.1 unnamed protein product [Acidocella sp. C78]
MSQTVFQSPAKSARTGALGRESRARNHRPWIGAHAGIGLLLLADLAATWLGPQLGSQFLLPAPTMARGPLDQLVYAALTVITLAGSGLYEVGPVRAPLDHAAAIARALVAAEVLSLLRIAMLRPSPATPPLGTSFGWAIAAFALTAALLFGGRVAVARIWRRHEIGVARGAAALVTTAPCDRSVCARLDRLADHRLGYVFCWGLAGSSGLRAIADAATLEAMIRSGQIGDLIVFIRRGDGAETRARLDALLARLADQPVRIRLAFDAAAEIGAGDLAASLGLRLVTALDRPIRPLAASAKRGMDIVGAGLLIVLLSPLLAAIALALRLSGPVLFRQRRIGLDGVPFTVFKFRTMRPLHATQGNARIVQARAGDRRITRLGRLLRRLSLDELPQLVNVLRGDMSLVGPRPHAPNTGSGDFTFEQAITFYGVRHRVKPGLTGLAQVRGLRGPVDRRDLVAARVAADLDYIERWSVWLDIAILLRTVPAVLIGRNAV